MIESAEKDVRPNLDGSNRIKPPQNADPDDSDEALMCRVQAGDRRALGTLFERYCRLVLGVSMRILRDREEAEDVMQSVFLEIFRRSHRFDSRKGSFRTWLLQYAYHRSFNRRRDLTLRLHKDLEQAVPNEALNASPHIWGGLTREEARSLLSKALGDLSDIQFSTLSKVFFQGYRLREVAEESGISLSNVRHYYYRGLERLRRALCR